MEIPGITTATLPRHPVETVAQFGQAQISIAIIRFDQHQIALSWTDASENLGGNPLGRVIARQVGWFF